MVALKTGLTNIVRIRPDAPRSSALLRCASDKVF